MGVIAKLRDWFKKRPSYPFLDLDIWPWERTRGRIRPGDYQEMVKAYSSWVYACASKNASTCAQIPLRLFVVKTGKSKFTVTRTKEISNETRKWLYSNPYLSKWTQKAVDIEEVTEHPFLDLVRSVNPWMNEFELRELTVLFQELTGNCYWYLVKSPLGTPKEIWILQAQRMRVVPDPVDFIRGYIYEKGTQKEAFSPEEIIHFKYPNPKDYFYGMGPLEGAANAVDVNQYIRDYEMAVFENRARPDFVLTTNERLGDADIQRLIGMWNKLYKGPKKAGKTAVLDKGLKPQEISISPRDLNFLVGRKMTREEIANIFGVPIALLTSENVNRANAEVSSYVYMRDTILPRLRRIEQKLNEKLLPLYDERLFCAFDNPIPEDKEFMLKERETNIKIGFTTRNEERAKVGLEPLEGGDYIWMPMNQIPIGGTKTVEEIIEKAAEKMAVSLIKNIKDREEEEREKKRERIWKAFVERITPQERRFRDEIAKLFEEQRKVVLANLSKLPKSHYHKDESIIDFILFGFEEWRERFEVMGTPFIAEAVRRAGNQSLAELGLTVDFDMDNPEVQRFIGEKTRKFSRDINKTTLEALIEELKEGFAEGESIQDLRKRINKVFDQAATYRAERIARTEIVGSSNRGALEAYKQSGIVQKKEWLTARDEKVRDSHWAADGQVKDIDEPFVLGSGVEIMYPGGDGPPGEIVNCRCTVRPVVPF